MLRIIVTPAAQIDTAEAIEWYEQQSQSLGLRFWMEFRRVIQRLKSFPDAYPPTGRRGIRKAPIATFPYGVFYRRIGDELRILGIIHAARDPKFIRSRIS